MNGIHDLGGMQGHGPINPPKSEPIFKQDWERRVFAMFAPAAIGAGFNIDEFRHGIERMGHVDYLDTTYYEHWLATYITNLIEKGVITEDELKKKMDELRGDA